MKPNKPLKEAILRAPESTEENQQPQQEQLYHLGSAQSVTSGQQAPHEQENQTLINESSRNRVESLHNLRELEYEVEKAKKK